MDWEILGKVSLFIGGAIATGIIGNRADAWFRKQWSTMTVSFATRQQRATQDDEAYAGRLAADTQQLVLFVGTIILAVLAIGAVTLGLSLYAVADYTKQYLLALAPIMGCIGAVWFCVMGMRLLSRTAAILRERHRDLN